MTLRTTNCPRHVRAGRLAKADQFWQAAEILATGLGKHVKTLLDIKTRSGYTHELSSQTDQKRAGRAAQALMSAARSAHSAAG